MKSEGRTGTADNDINAIRNMGMIPEGYTVNHYLTSAKNSSLKLMFLMVLNISLDHLSKLLWKVTLILVTLDTKLEKDMYLDSLIQEVSSDH
jgi:hypothetical protein